MVYRNLSYVSHLKQETFWFIKTTHDQRLYLFYMMLHLYTHPLFPLTPASTFSMHWFRQTVELRTTTIGPGRNSLLCFDNIVIELNPGTLLLVSRDQCPKTLLYSNKDNNGQTAMLWSPISRTDPVQISVILTIIEINALFHSNKKKSTRMVNYNIRSSISYKLTYL